MLTLGDLTYAIISTNALLDRGHNADITIEEIEEHIRSGDVFAFVRERVVEKGLVPFAGLLKPTAEAAINDRLRDQIDVWAGNENRKWGVKQSGLCLLLAWIAELIQQSLAETEVPAFR